jgi:hypothetical protein
MMIRYSRSSPLRQRQLNEWLGLHESQAVALARDRKKDPTSYGISL